MCVFVGFGMIRLRKLFLFLEFLGVSDSQRILFVFGLIKWAVSVSVAHLSHKHVDTVETHS